MSLDTEDFSDFFMFLLPSLNGVIEANQTADKPQKPYAVYRIISDLPVGHHEEKNNYNAVSNLVETTILENTKIQLELQIITNPEPQTEQKSSSYISARQYSKNLTIQLPLARTFEYSNSLGFTILDYIDYSNFDLNLVDKWERRAILEFSINYTQSLKTSTNQMIAKPTTLDDFNIIFEEN